MKREPLFIVIFGITRNVLRSRDMMLEKSAMATDKNRCPKKQKRVEILKYITGFKNII